MQTYISFNRIKMEFARRRKRQIVIHVIIMATITARLFGKHFGWWDSLGLSSADATVYALVLMVVALGYTLYNWRCPACGGYLGRKLFTEQCRKCGMTLI